MDDLKLFYCVVWVCLLCLWLDKGFKYKYPVWFKRKDEAIYVSSSKNNLTMETYKIRLWIMDLCSIYELQTLLARVEILGHKIRKSSSTALVDSCEIGKAV